jgi:hypothetical protein
MFSGSQTSEEVGRFVSMHAPKFFFGKHFNEICPQNYFKQIKIMEDDERREASEASSRAGVQVSEPYREDV